MFGYFRFFLALLVLASHLNGTMFGVFNPGWGAVFIFYILAGSVTAKIFNNVFSQDLKAFYKDRFLRIYPMAIFWAILSIFILALILPNNLHLKTIDIFYILTIIPLDYFSFLSINTLPDEIVGLNFVWPPYFSLGLEIQLYIMLGLCLKYLNHHIFRALAITSFISFAIFAIFGIFKDGQMILSFTYTLPFQVFFLFYIGTLLYKDKIKEYYIWYTLIFALLAIQLIRNIGYGSTPDTLIFLIFFMPMVHLMYKNKTKIKGNTFFASMSFIIYCNHYLVVYFYQKLNNIENIIFSWNLFLIIASISFLIGLPAYYMIEKKINSIRNV